jgi:chromosome condensin MukBEF MukE localization factor
MIVNLGGFNVWIRNSRNIINHLFGCLATAKSISVDALGNPLSWKEPFLLALEESDQRKLTELVRASERALFLRQMELNIFSECHEERSELSVAAVALLTIKTHKLSWPTG